MHFAIADTADGPVEFAEEGMGPAVLLLHGPCAACRERVVHPPLANAGYRLIVPSRPGYGRTPLAAGGTAPAAADAMSNLLASLDIARAIVVAVSSAGPTGICLAVRHPTQVAGLVLESAATCPAGSGCGRPASHRRFYTGCHTWRWGFLRLAARLAPRLTAVRIVAATSLHDTLDIRARLAKPDLEMVKRFLEVDSSATGALADWEHEATDADLVAVRTPTLIVHSRFDRSVPFASAERAHRLIRGSQLFPADTWGHLLWLGPGAEGVTQRVIGFLASLAPQDPSVSRPRR